METKHLAERDSLGRSQVVLLLKSLSKEELREFDKFVRSPLHNSRKEVVRYLKELKQFHPAFEHPKFTKQKIYSKLYQGSAYRDDVIRLLNSYLLKCLRNFLIFQRLNKDELLSQKLFLEQLINRNADSLAESEYGKCLAQLENRPRAENYYKDKAEIEQLAMIHYSKKEQDFKEGERYYKVPEYWVCHSMIRLFRGLQNLHAVSRSFRKEPEIGLLSAFSECFNEEKFVDLLQSNSPNYSPDIGMAYYQYKMWQEKNNEEHFFKLWSLLRKESGKLDYWLKDEVYSSLIDYCDYKSTEEANEKFTRIDFDLIKEMEKDGMFISGNRPSIDLTTFEVCCYHALSLKEHEWFKYFLNKYSERIDPLYRSNLTNYFWAEYYYAIKSYDSALNCLAKTSYQRLIDNIRIKGLALRIYYDIGDAEGALSTIDSAKHASFIKKDKSNQWTIKSFKNFVSVLEKMIKIREKMNIEDIVELKDKIKNIEFIAPRPWLLNRIEELEKKARGRSSV